MKPDLSKLSREEKINFLSRLQSGRFKIKPSNDQDINTELNFDRVQFGIYKCQETGENWTREMIESKDSDSIIIIDLIERREELGQNDPGRIQLIPLSTNCLNKFLEAKK